MSTKSLCIIMAVFLILKLALAFFGPRMAPSDNTADAIWYLERAAGFTQTGSLLEADGSKTALFPIGFSYLLGTVGIVFGPTLQTAVILNSLLSLVAAALVYMFADTLFNRRAAIAAGLVMLIAPAQYIYSQQAFSEHLFTVLLLLTLLIALFVVRRHVLFALLSGLLIALACLTRGQGLVLLVWFPLAMLIFTGKWRPAVTASALMLLAWLLVMAPWWVRNYRAFDRFVLISNNSGKNLCVGNIDTRLARPNFKYILDRRPADNEADYDHRLKTAASEYIRSYPGKFIADAPLKVFWLYAADAVLSFRHSVISTYGRVVGLMVLGFGQLLWMVLAVASILGLLKTGFSPPFKPQNVLYLMLILWALFHTIFFGGARFNFPMFPIVATTAAAWLYNLRGTPVEKTV